MVPQLVLALGLLLTADDAKDAEEARHVRRALLALNQAFQDRDEAAIRRLAAADHVAITPYYGRLLSLDEEVKSLPDLRLTEYTAAEQKITWATKDVAIITYHLTQKGTFKGKELAPRSHVAAVWARRDGKWQEVSYQETPIADR